jgi:hypothetical protein
MFRSLIGALLQIGYKWRQPDQADREARGQSTNNIIDILKN